MDELRGGGGDGVARVPVVLRLQQPVERVVEAAQVPREAVRVQRVAEDLRLRAPPHVWRGVLVAELLRRVDDVFDDLHAVGTGRTEGEPAAARPLLARAPAVLGEVGEGEGAGQRDAETHEVLAAPQADVLPARLVVAQHARTLALVCLVQALPTHRRTSVHTTVRVAANSPIHQFCTLRLFSYIVENNKKNLQNSNFFNIAIIF